MRLIDIETEPEHTRDAALSYHDVINGIAQKFFAQFVANVAA